MVTRYDSTLKTVTTAKLADDAVTVTQLDVGVTWSFTVPGVSGQGTDFLNGSIAGADKTLDLTKTEIGLTFAKVLDASASTYYNLKSSSVGDHIQYQALPNNTQIADHLYIGFSKPFPQMWFDVTTVATYNANVFTWQYWNGSTWFSLTISYDGSNASVHGGERPWAQDGSLVIQTPSNWTLNTVDGQSAYWIRATPSSVGDLTQIPIFNSVNPYIVVLTDGFKCPETGTIAGIRLTNGNATTHSAADIKFFLHNFTTSARSDILTFAQEKRNERWDSTAFKTGGLAVATGDILGVVITQPDTGNELTNFTIEMDVDL